MAERGIVRSFLLSGKLDGKLRRSVPGDETRKMENRRLEFRLAKVVVTLDSPKQLQLAIRYYNGMSNLFFNCPTFLLRCNWLSGYFCPYEVGQNRAHHDIPLDVLVTSNICTVNVFEGSWFETNKGVQPAVEIYFTGLDPGSSEMTEEKGDVTALFMYRTIQ